MNRAVVLALAVSLGACSSDDDSGSASSPTPSASATPTPSSAATPTASVTPTVSVTPSPSPYGPVTDADFPSYPAPPACGSGDYDWDALLPGPGRPGHNAELAALAHKYDRQFRAFNASATGLNADIEIDVSEEALRTEIETWLDTGSGFEFVASDGRPAVEVISRHRKVAGLYGGVGVVADAFRYATLRDQGAPCGDIEIAREHLRGDIEQLHTVVNITGAPGVIARGIARVDLPGDGPSQTLIPLFDEDGNALPLEKNNGAWRADFSGDHEDLIWEDSCSRDMIIGWAAAYAAAWEVIRDDDSFDEALKTRLREDAQAVARQFPIVRESGYDLEIPDADGRTTLNGYLHENNLDRGPDAYIDALTNGFHALMAVGIVGAFAFASGDQQTWDYLNDTLIRDRELVAGALEHMFVDLGRLTNFSAVNMGFMAIWLAQRYLPDPELRESLRRILDEELYYRGPDRDLPTAELRQSLFDFMWAAGMQDQWAGRNADSDFDETAVTTGVTTLMEFPDPPAWNFPRINCDDEEIEAGQCVANDGSEFGILGYVGRNETLMADRPIPLRTRGPTNYTWRSTPYRPNTNGNGALLYPGVDFRFAYWLGRWTRR